MLELWVFEVLLIFTSKIATLTKVWSNKQFKVALLWFVFIAFGLGQFGAFLVLAKAVWFGESIVCAYESLVESGSFITFATTLLASSVFFLIKDYIRGKTAIDPTAKAMWLLGAFFLASLGILISFFLISGPISLNWRHQVFHWLVYVFCILVAIRFWTIEYFESSDAWAREIEEDTRVITQDAAKMTETSDGLVL